MGDHSVVKDYLWLHLVVMVWGLTAVLGLLISLPAVEMVFYRTWMAGAGLLLLLVWKKIRFRMPPRELTKILGTGALIGLHWILFFAAARVSTASVGLAGMATCSLWTALIEPLINKNKIKWYEVMLGLLVILGLYVIFRFETGYWLGLSLAVASAFLGACFMVLNGRFAKRHHPYVVTLYYMVGAGIFTALLMPLYALYFTPEGLNLAPAGWDWVWLLVLSQFCTVFALSVSVELMKRITAFAVNLTVNMEPVYGIILAVLVFGEKEKMTSGFYLGTVIILCSVCLYPLIHYVHKRKVTRQLRRLQ